MSSKELPDKIRKELEKIGVDPDTIERYDDIDPNMYDKFVVITGKIDGYAIQLCPPIKIVAEGEASGINFRFDDNDFSLDKNNLLKLTGKNTIDAVEKFNKLVTYLNLIGIPMDFVSGYDIILLIKLKSATVETNLSTQSKIRGEGIADTELEYGKFEKIIEYANLINKRASDHELYKDSKIVTFYGRGYYYGFHSDEFYTFLYFWLFIEASIHWMWRFFTKQVYKSFIPNENTPLVRKIDELYLLGKISEKNRMYIHELRKKRNNIFHVNPDPGRRRITEAEIKNAIRISNIIFYRSLDLKFNDSLNIEEIRMKMHKYIHKHPDPNEIK